MTSRQRKQRDVKLSIASRLTRKIEAAIAKHGTYSASWCDEARAIAEELRLKKKGN